MLGLCQPMIDVVLSAGVFEGVRPDGLSGVQGGLDVGRSRARIAWRGEVGSVVGEDGMDLVRDGGDQAAQEVSGGAARHLLVQLDEGELRRSVDGDEEVELALRGSNLGDVDMKIADRIGLEFAFGARLRLRPAATGRSRGVADTGEATSASDAGWSAAARTGSRRAAAKYAFGRRRRPPLPHADRTVDLGSFGPVGRSETEVRALPLGDRLRVDAVALRQRPQALLTMLYRSTDRLVCLSCPPKRDRRG